MSESTNEITLNDILNEIKEMKAEMKEKMKKMVNKFDRLEREINYLKNEIEIVKLTQNYVYETGGIRLEKPLDSISLSSFLTDEIEENSYFKLFR